MRRRRLKAVVALFIVFIMCFGLASCGGGQTEEEQQTDTSTEAVEETQTFTTTDGTYQITTGSEWTENDSYENSDSSLELEIGGGITILQIIKQPKSDLGISLEAYSEEVTGYFVDNEALGNSTVESTENVKCGDHDAIKKLISTTESSSGIDMFTCHLSIEFDSDYMQMIIISTNSNRDKVLEYADEISSTITPI